MDDCEEAFIWICFPSQRLLSDIWDTRRHWHALKPVILQQLNEGVYEFSSLDRYECDDVPPYLLGYGTMVFQR